MLILRRALVKEIDQPILDAEADWKALVEGDAGDPLRVGEQLPSRCLFFSKDATITAFGPEVFSKSRGDKR